MGLFSNRSQKTSKCAAHVSLPCFHYILTSSVIYYWTDACQNGIYLLNGHHAPVNDAKQFPKASHLSGLQILLDVCCYCPGFTGVQQSWDYQGVHKSDLWAKRDYYAQSFQMVFSLASAAVFCAIRVSTCGLEPWSWRLCPDTSTCPLINLVQFFINEKTTTLKFLFIWWLSCLFLWLPFKFALLFLIFF